MKTPCPSGNLGREAKKSHKLGRNVVNINLSYLYYLRSDETGRPAPQGFSAAEQESPGHRLPVPVPAGTLSRHRRRANCPRSTALPEKEINVLIKGNIFLKGWPIGSSPLSGRWTAPPEEIIPILNYAVRWLDEAGHQIELSKTRLELARQYLAGGEEGKAQELMQITSKILATFNEEMVPDDLRP